MKQTLVSLLQRFNPSPYILRTCQALIEREQVGLQKYGVALDQGGYTHEQLLQHLYEELLDGANYVRVALDTERKSNQEYALLRRALEQLIRDEERPTRYTYTRTYQEGREALLKRLRGLLLDHDSGAVLRQLGSQR